MGGKEWLEAVISARRFKFIKRSIDSKHYKGRTLVTEGIRFGFKEREGVRRIAEVKQHYYLPDSEYLFTEIVVYSRFWKFILFSIRTVKEQLDRAILNEMFHKVTNLYIYPFF